MRRRSAFSFSARSRSARFFSAFSLACSCRACSQLFVFLQIAWTWQGPGGHTCLLTLTLTLNACGHNDVPTVCVMQASDWFINGLISLPQPKNNSRHVHSKADTVSHVMQEIHFGLQITEHELSLLYSCDTSFDSCQNCGALALLFYTGRTDDVLRISFGCTALMTASCSGADTNSLFSLHLLLSLEFGFSCMLLIQPCQLLGFFLQKSESDKSENLQRFQEPLWFDTQCKM